MHEVRAEITGKVIQIRVSEGDAVDVGTVLVVLESMKMEFLVEADVAGVVHEVPVAAGDDVAEGHVLIVVDAG